MPGARLRAARYLRLERRCPSALTLVRRAKPTPPFEPFKAPVSLHLPRLSDREKPSTAPLNYRGRNVPSRLLAVPREALLETASF